MPRVTTALLLVVCLLSPLIFAVTVWLTRASARRATAALSGGVAGTVLILGWDALAAQMGWWRYPASNDLLATLALALSVGFVFGGAAGLAGWRMMRAMGWSGVAAFFAGFVGLGVLRDHLLAVNTNLLVLGSTGMPLVMGAVGYLTIAVAVQVAMLVMAGPPRADALRA